MVVSATHGEADQIRSPRVATRRTLAAGLPVHQPVRVFHSSFPAQRQLLLEHLVPWLMQAEKRFRGTLDLTYALLLLWQEATLLR